MNAEAVLKHRVRNEQTSGQQKSPSKGVLIFYFFPAHMQIFRPIGQSFDSRRERVKEEKADQETNIKTNILTELERVAAATSLRTEEKPPPDASTAAATSSSGIASADTGEPLLAAMACRT
jgi:hypothetical protein